MASRKRIQKLYNELKEERVEKQHKVLGEHLSNWFAPNRPNHWVMIKWLYETGKYYIVNPNNDFETADGDCKVVHDWFKETYKCEILVDFEADSNRFRLTIPRSL